VYFPVKEIVYINQNQIATTDSVVLTSKPIVNDKIITLNRVKNQITPTNQLNVVNKEDIFEVKSNNSDDEKIVKKGLEELKFSFISLDFKKFDSLNVFLQLPNINYQNRMIYRRVIKQDNTISFKNPSIKIFYAPESAYVSTIKDGSLIAETIGTEKNHHVYSYGANLSFDLTDKWSLETGLNFSYSQFYTVGAVKKRPLVAEMYKGSPQYLYRTALGLAIIPSDQLNTKPVVGNAIIVESEDTHVLKQFKIPLLVKYKLYEGNKLLGAYTNRYSLYSIMGAELRYNRSQMLNAEIYEADGTDFYTAFTDFKEVKPYNVGLVFGTGFDYNLAKKISFYVEPTIRLSTASYSQSTIVKSFPRWWSFAFGFKYNLK
jgi:hypothetical protein